MNAEFAKTDAGKIQQAKNTLGDMGEEIGAVLLPAVADLATWIGENLLPKIQSLIDWLGQHPKIATFALALAGITAVAGPLIMIIGGIVSAIGTLITFAPILAGAFGAISAPVLAVVAAIAAAIAIGVALYKNWDTIKAKALQVFKIIATTVKVNFMTLKNAVTTIWNGIKTAITKPIETAKSVVQKAINKIKSFFPLKVGKIFSGMKLPHFSIKGSPPFGIGGKGTKPSISVNWYKKAMQQPYMFSNATLFGAGESGDEMLYGRNSLLNDIATATGGGEVVARLAAIEAILDYYLPKGQQIVMDNGALIGQVNRGLGMRL
jgi:phage-related minor tail protein